MRIKDVRYEAVENFKPLEIDRMPSLGNRFAFRSWNKIREGRVPTLEAVALSLISEREFSMQRSLTDQQPSQSAVIGLHLECVWEFMPEFFSFFRSAFAVTEVC